MSEVKIRYTPMRYVNLEMPQGWLTRDMACHACWCYYTMCEAQIRAVGKSIDDQTILDDQLWMSYDFESLAWSVVIAYGLNSPEDWQPYWKNVTMQANEFGYPRPRPEYMKRTMQ